MFIRFKELVYCEESLPSANPPSFPPSSRGISASAGPGTLVGSPAQSDD